jgi:hypothetical protein
MLLRCNREAIRRRGVGPAALSLTIAQARRSVAEVLHAGHLKRYLTSSPTASGAIRPSQTSCKSCTAFTNATIRCPDGRLRGASPPAGIYAEAIPEA